MRLLYRIKNLDKDLLWKNGYRQQRLPDNKYDGHIYYKYIPVWKENGRASLTGTITIRLPSGRIMYDVTDGNGQLYAPFYNPDSHYSHEILVNRISKAFLKELECLDTRPTKDKFVR